MNAAQLPLEYDWKHPDFLHVFERRVRLLDRLRADKRLLAAFHVHYKATPAQFIIDWGVTFDPKNVERGLPTMIPFVLFPKQIEWIDWIERKWHAGEPGLCVKTRQMGFSWLAMAYSCTKCLYNDGLVIGFGSRKEEYVDRIGDPKSLIEKGRIFLRTLPPEFRGGWTESDGPHKTLRFHEGSLIAGEAGDEIGRGNTTSLYFVDEAAFIERPAKVDAALSQTTNCRIDISTPNGMANTFAQKRFGGKVEVFEFGWRDDPRKDQAWYDKQKSELDPVIVAQEIDRSFSASVEGVVIPSAWVEAAIDAHTKLGITPSGKRSAALDVADEGRDKMAMAGRHGILLERLKSWSGKGGTIYKSTLAAFNLCDEWGYDNFEYDADGLGAGVRGDADAINAIRKAMPLTPLKPIAVEAFRGSAAVSDPESQMVKGRFNKDFFVNYKAQSWWHLRLMFERTYEAVTAGKPFDPDKIISIDSKLPELLQLQMELSQPTFTRNEAGKIVVDKQPDNVLSPNLADAVMIAYHPGLRRRSYFG